jgi:S1-C subfamily serine protease
VLFKHFPHRSLYMKTMGHAAAASLAAVMIASIFSAFGQSGPKIASPSTPRPLADVVDQVDRSVVRVVARFTGQARTQDGTVQTVGWTGAGTGFILDAQARVVTAGHIVNLEMNRAAFEKALATQQLVPVPDSFRPVDVIVSAPPLNIEQDQHGNEFSNVNAMHRAGVVKEDSQLDIALLASDPGLLTRPDFIIDGRSLTPLRTVPIFQGNAPRPGDSISVSGFPAVSGFAAGIPSLVTNGGIVSSTSFRDERGRWVYLADLHANHGDSGGPVFNNETGEVIGFVDAYYPATNGENSGLTVVIPIRQILRSLQAGEKVVAGR